MENSYNTWMNTKQEVINATIGPSNEALKLAYAELDLELGKDNYFENREKYDEAYRLASTNLVFKNKSHNEVQALIEHLRIMNPDAGSSLTTPNGDFIGNVTWNDQMKMFWEYKTFTDEGKKLQAERREEAKRLGLTASWE